jgi:uncharacterized lipoprotein YajG
MALKCAESATIGRNDMLKKIILLTTAIALLAAIGCSKSEDAAAPAGDAKGAAPAAGDGEGKM